MHRNTPYGLAGLAAAAALSAALPNANATPYTYQTAGAGGSYYTDAGNVVNTNYGQSYSTNDGSNYQFVTCVGSKPGEPGCSVPNPPIPEPDTWYKLPALPTSAAAQSWSPDYGISRARAWTTGTEGIGTGAPGYTRYAAAAQSGFIEEITTSSAVPITITFIVSLHVDWNDGGVFSYIMGRPGDYDPDVGGSTPMIGHTWTNCGVCEFGYDTGSGERTVVPGGADGSATILLSLPYTVYPASFGDPEDPNPFANVFEAQLGAFASENDAETEAFSTATLQAILVPANAGLAFASGHAYNVQVVPEPASWALWATGLAGLLTALRRRRPEELTAP